MSDWSLFFRDDLTFAKYTQYRVGAFALCCGISFLLYVYIPGIMLETLSSFIFWDIQFFWVIYFDCMSDTLNARDHYNC